MSERSADFGQMASGPQDVGAHIESLVLAVHRRNGGQRRELDLKLPLLDASLDIDSLDLAEIVVGIEREYRVALFEAAQPPRTWENVVQVISRAQGSLT